MAIIKKKNNNYLLRILLVWAAATTAVTTTMASSSTKASIADAVSGEWKLRELWEETEEAPLSITRDGQPYVMRIVPSEGPSSTNPTTTTLGLSVKVGNNMRTQIRIPENSINVVGGSTTTKIEIDSVGSTRMMPGTEEKRQLENFLSRNLPKMTSMRVLGVGGGEEEEEEREPALVLESDNGATRIVCGPLGASSS